MKNTRKIALYNPFFDILGGGERHILSIVKIFDDMGFQVDILWNDSRLLAQIDKAFNIKFKNINLVDNFIVNNNPYKRYLMTSKYHSLFYVTDGSYFFSGAANSYIFCMYPKQSIYKGSFINRLKWINFKFIVNSEYTKNFIDKWTGKSSTVIYPYIQESVFNTNHSFKKEKIILSVGRYFKHLHSKRQDLLIKAFKKLKQADRAFKDFKLIMIGRLKEEDKPFFLKLQKLASSDKNINLLQNVSEEELRKYYKKALFFWHGAGVESDFRNQPETTEHLGIAPLEAMAAGIIVFCHNSGGPAELIQDGKNGFLYESIDQLVKKTSEIYKNPDKIKKISFDSGNFVKTNFSKNNFTQKVKSIFHL